MSVAPTLPAARDSLSPALPAASNYAEIWRSRYFQKMSLLAFFNYGGFVAIQTLWAGPWMVRVAGYTPLESATGLFYINAVMLVTFWAWGMLNPVLARKGWSPDRLISWCLPVSMLVLAATGVNTGAAAAAEDDDDKFEG